MEKAKQEAFDRARLQVIKDGYERAFECINKGLSEDEAGRRAQALELYRQGRQHLLRALSVPSRGEECVGSSWDSARQMQQKMQETLDNITTRLAVLETGPGASAPPVPNGSVPQHLYPALPKERPDRPTVLLPSAPPAGPGPEASSAARGAAPVSPAQPRGASCEQPPAYSPKAADGHLSISYGTATGELSLVGDEFYSPTPSSAPSPQSLGEDGEELFFLPHGVQIFFVTPDGQVSAPSYPGYLRIVKFTNEHSERVPRRPPAFLQVACECV